MLKSYFITGNGLVNRGSSQRSAIIHPRFLILIFIIIFSQSYFFGFPDFTFAYSLPQSPNMLDGAITTGNTYDGSYTYRPVVEGQPLEFTI